MNSKIAESTDVNLYKMLLNIFGSYVKSFPCTGVDDLFNILINVGKKVLPKDIKALSVLTYVVTMTGAVPDVVQKLLNMRFSDLPVEERPVIKDKQSEAILWNRNGITSDRIKDLINFTNTGIQGYWSDSSGDKVTIIL